MTLYIIMLSKSKLLHHIVEAIAPSVGEDIVTISVDPLAVSPMVQQYFHQR